MYGVLIKARYCWLEFLLIQLRRQHSKALFEWIKSNSSSEFLKSQIWAKINHKSLSKFLIKICLNATVKARLQTSV